MGGSLGRSDDYVPLARTLARSFAVHLVDRRGRGESGEQRPHYGMDVECADLLAVVAATEARFAFGHSYGGLVCLETAQRAPVLSAIATYEPGISVGPRPFVADGPGTSASERATGASSFGSSRPRSSSCASNIAATSTKRRTDP